MANYSTLEHSKNTGKNANSEFQHLRAAPGESTRLVLSTHQLRELVLQFTKESNNQIRDMRTVDSAIRRTEELGFLRAVGAAESGTLEVMRILKARFGPSELES